LYDEIQQWGWPEAQSPLTASWEEENSKWLNSGFEDLIDPKLVDLSFLEDLGVQAWSTNDPNSSLEIEVEPTNPLSSLEDCMFLDNSVADFFGPPTPPASIGETPTSSPQLSLQEEPPLPSCNDAKIPKQKKSKTIKKPRKNPSTRAERKKVQNKEAATRYRIKKRAENEALSEEISGLEQKNTCLKDKVNDLTREISYLKGLMKELEERVLQSSPK